MLSKSPKSQFIYGLLSASIFFFCLSIFTLVTTLASFSFPLTNSGFGGSPYKICNGLSDYSEKLKPAVNVEECIKTLTNENQETEKQNKTMSVISSISGAVITLIAGIFSYNLSKKNELSKESIID
jgi:hypothetical protein